MKLAIRYICVLVGSCLLSFSFAIKPINALIEEKVQFLNSSLQLDPFERCGQEYFIDELMNLLLDSSDDELVLNFTEPPLLQANYNLAIGRLG